MSSISRWLCKNSSKNMFVKIVHPGGHVELHDRPILAAELLNRNPKCCVAHPTIFQQPHAVVSPETTLLLGRKYYIVPLGTIRKLQLKHCRRPHARAVGGDVAAVNPKPTVSRKSGSNRDGICSSSPSSCWLFRNDEERERRGKEDGGELGTRIGVGSSGSSGDDETARMVRRESGGGGGRRVGKEFDGDGESSSPSSPGRISLQSVDNWQPGLNSICEEY